MFSRSKWAFFLFLWGVSSSVVQAEYCIDWKSWLQKYAGQSGHCWNSESECNSYYFSRCMSSTYKNDCAGSCYYKAGLYPKTGSAKAGKTSNGIDQTAAKAAEEKQKKQDALNKAFRQKKFDTEKANWLNGLKGVEPSSPSNQIVLKPIPPAGGLARSQLDCIANNDANRSWEQRALNCTPIIPNVPEPGIPVEVVAEPPADPALLNTFLEALHQRLSATRESLAKADREIVALEKEIALKEQKTADPKALKGESDAMKRAREALAKAKADRARTAQELSKLEQQEAAAQKKSPEK
ncbi:MAG TPA: hypothetical protein VJA83_06455 [Sulfuricurvum sp.]|nr:hypothetical protein [Sulfuricurvum sp.]